MEAQSWGPKEYFYGSRIAEKVGYLLYKAMFCFFMSTYVGFFIEHCKKE